MSNVRVVVEETVVESVAWKNKAIGGGPLYSRGEYLGITLGLQTKSEHLDHVS